MDRNAPTFTLLSEDGTETTYEVLFSYQSRDTGKYYLAYTDHSLDPDGNMQVFASSYNPDDIYLGLTPIETELEWGMLEIILEELLAGSQ